MRLNYRAACSQYGHIPKIKKEKIICDRCNKPLLPSDQMAYGCTFPSITKVKEEK